MLAIRSDQIAINQNNPKLGFDPLSDGIDDGGLPMIFDFFSDYEASHLATTYENGDVITNLSEGSNGVFSKEDLAQQIETDAIYGGLDFSTSTDSGNEVLAPAGALDTIHGGSQYFAVAMWLVLPAKADWNTAAALVPFFCCTSEGAGYTAEADMVTISQANTAPPALNIRRQKDGAASIDSISIIPEDDAFGKLALVMVWRNAAGFGARIKTSASDQQTAIAKGTDNSGDFSQKRARWGQCGSFGNNPATTGNFTLCRGWIENLEITAREPATLFEEEWDRVEARMAELL